MVPSFKVEGLDELDRALAGLSVRTRKGLLRDALLEGGERIRARASNLAPRAPGKPDVADQIQIAPVRDREHEASVGIGVPKAFFYDYFLERGTVHMSAQPFYRPAIDSEGEQAIAEMGKALWRSLAAKGIRRAATVVDVPVQTVGGGGLL